MQKPNIIFVFISAFTGVSFAQPTTPQHGNTARQNAAPQSTCNIQRGTVDSWFIKIPDEPPAAGVNKCDPFTQGIQATCKEWKQLTCDYDDEDSAWSIGLATEKESCQEVDVEATLGELDCVVEVVNPDDEVENLGFGEGVLRRA